MFFRGFPGGVGGDHRRHKTLGLMPGGEDPLQKEMTAYSIILVWKIPWTEEPGRLQSMGLQRVAWLSAHSLTLLFYNTECFWYQDASVFTCHCKFSRCVPGKFCLCFLWGQACGLWIGKMHVGHAFGMSSTLKRYPCQWNSDCICYLKILHDLQCISKEISFCLYDCIFQGSFNLWKKCPSCCVFYHTDVIKLLGTAVIAYWFFDCSLWPVKVKVAQLYPTLCNPMDSIVPGILQTRILEWEAFSFSRVSSQPRDWTQVSHIAGGFFTSWATREAQEYWSG